MFSGSYLVFFSGMKDSCQPDEDRFNMVQFHEATDVYFTEVSSEIVRSYIDTGEPM